MSGSTETGTNGLKGRGDTADGTPTKALHCVPRVGLCCFGAAILILAAQLSWSLLIAETPAAILPPAGEVIEGTAPFTFAVVGDSQGHMGIFEDILARIKAEDVSFILHMGDLVSRDDARQFDWVLHELHEQMLTVPFCPVPGNHDTDWANEDTKERYLFYSGSFGPRRYWFAWANALFVAFDTSGERCSAEDLAWLDRTLSRLRGGYEACFVYTHVPPRDPRPGKSHALEAGAEDLMRVLKTHNVTAVFAGHIHSYLQDDIGGIPVYISGGAGGRLQEPKGPYHYLLCTVEPGGSFRLEKRDMDHVFDSDSLEKFLRVNSQLYCFAVFSGLVVVGGVSTGLGALKQRMVNKQRRTGDPCSTRSKPGG